MVDTHSCMLDIESEGAAHKRTVSLESTAAKKDRQDDAAPRQGGQGAPAPPPAPALIAGGTTTATSGSGGGSAPECDGSATSGVVCSTSESGGNAGDRRDVLSTAHRKEEEAAADGAPRLPTSVSGTSLGSGHGSLQSLSSDAGEAESGRGVASHEQDVRVAAEGPTGGADTEEGGGERSPPAASGDTAVLAAIAVESAPQAHPNGMRGGFSAAAGPLHGSEEGSGGGALMRKKLARGGSLMGVFPYVAGDGNNDDDAEAGGIKRGSTEKGIGI